MGSGRDRDNEKESRGILIFTCREDLGRPNHRIRGQGNVPPPRYYGEMVCVLSPLCCEWAPCVRRFSEPNSLMSRAVPLCCLNDEQDIHSGRG